MTALADLARLLEGPSVMALARGGRPQEPWTLEILSQVEIDVPTHLDGTASHEEATR